MTKQELKPCPFCGSQAKSDLSDFGSAMVYCGAEDVGVDCPVNAETGFHDSMESSIAAWNARPADPLTGELVEALEAIRDNGMDARQCMEHACAVLAKVKP